MLALIGKSVGKRKRHTLVAKYQKLHKKLLVRYYGIREMIVFANNEGYARINFLGSFSVGFVFMMFEM